LSTSSQTTDQFAHRKLTQAELLAEARARFGNDPMVWGFQCPRCKDIAFGATFKEALSRLPRERQDGMAVIASDLLGQECIGRTDPKRGCDWAAYGLIRGPWEIVLPDGRSVWGFPLAPALKGGAR
jgi:hypothetical protein